jgi:crossover junction endodeoxyribonuclease RuvC
MLAVTLRDVPVAEYSPTQIKSAVAGTGRATKDQIQYMVQQLLRLRTAPRPADAADGVAVAICHCTVGSTRAKLAGRPS